MLAVKAVGLDIAKSVFQVHGIDAKGKGVVRRKLKRRYVLAFFEKLPPFPGTGRASFGHRTLKCVLSIGTHSEQSIRASGHIRRINRPDT